MKNKQLFLKEGRGEELAEEESVRMRNLRMRYGFIFNGFKSDTFFYEVVI